MNKVFHHIGIPTTQQQPNEVYIAPVKLYVTDANASEHHIEWVRAEAGSPMPYLVKKTAHVAYTVDDLDEALVGKKVIVKPFEAMKGLWVAFIQEGEAPIEYMEFSK
jgi:desulfoferrodoxin (superoxide reductase-like protein)